MRGGLLLRSALYTFAMLQCSEKVGNLTYYLL
jgi:hypothetical protein